MEMIICPKCYTDITTMKYLTKIGMHWYCKCGKKVTRLKLMQLVKRIKES